MAEKRIVTDQAVSPEMKERSRRLRREMTPAESKLWQRLRAGRLEGIRFRRQQVIDNFIVDFYCHEAGMVIEVDGGVHLEQEEYDRRRDLALLNRGVQVLRFTNTDINQKIEIVLANVLETCKAKILKNLSLPSPEGGGFKLFPPDGR